VTAAGCVRVPGASAGGTGRWCGWPTGKSGLVGAGRSPGGLSFGVGLFMRTWSRGGDTPVQVNPVPRGLLTRRQGGSRRSRTRAAGAGCRARLAEDLRSPREVDRPGRGRCARTGTGRWCWRCCWPGCAGARCWGCGSPTCRSLTGGLAVGGGAKGGHHRVGPGREPVLRCARAPICMTRRPGDGAHGPGVRGAEGAAARPCRCRRKGWMRSWPAPAAGPGWSTRPAMSCGIRA